MQYVCGGGGIFWRRARSGVTLGPSFCATIVVPPTSKCSPLGQVSGLEPPTSEVPKSVPPVGTHEVHPWERSPVRALLSKPNYKHFTIYGTTSKLLTANSWALINGSRVSDYLRLRN
jgi:hypothetical protein